MKLTRRYDQHRRDFKGDFECEHCGHIEEGVTCYDDSHFHAHVIPGKVCKECGLTGGSPTTKPLQPDSKVM